MPRIPKGQVLVHLVGDNRRIVCATELSDQHQFLVRKHAASRVLRRIQDQRARFFAKGRAQLVGIKCPVGGMQWHRDRHSTRHQDIGHVRIVEWLDNDHLIARVNQPQYGG